MTNAELTTQMYHILDRYEAGEVDEDHVAQTIETLMGLMDGISLSAIHQTRDLTYRLETARFWIGEEDYFVPEQISDVLLDLRRFLTSIPSNTNPRLGHH